MQVIQYGDASPVSWEAACDDSGQAWLFHRGAWIDIESRWFVRSNYSFALAVRGEVIGVCPLYLSDPQTGTADERLLHTGIHRQSGIALREGLDTGAVLAARSAAMKRIFELANALNVDRIQLNAHNLAPENLGAEREEIPFWVEQYGFQPGLSFTTYGMLPAPGMATCNSDHVIILSEREEVLFSQVDDKSGRWAIRKAESFGLSFDTAPDVHAIDEFYELAKLSATRTGEVLLPKTYYQALWEAFADAGRCVVHFVRQGSTPLCAVILLIDKLSASYLAGVSDPQYLKTCANDLALWRSILWAKQRGLRAFRLGPWFPTVPKEWPIARVSRFKKKFGGRAYTIIQGSYFRHPEKYLAAGQKLLGVLCSQHEAKTCM